MKNLTNADFRKLMMTPRTSSAPAKESSKESSSAPEEAKTKTEATKDTKEDIRASERRKRKRCVNSSYQNTLLQDGSWVFFL